jgi:hypothetical protein
MNCGGKTSDFISGKTDRNDFELSASYENEVNIQESMATDPA